MRQTNQTNQTNEKQFDTRQRAPAIGISLSTSEKPGSRHDVLYQNVAFLAMMLERSGAVGPIYFLDGGDETVSLAELGLGDLGIPLVKPTDVTHELDVVIEAGTQLPAGWLRHMKALGKKRIVFFFGQVYADLCESPLFGKPSAYLFDGAPLDEVWLLSQYDRAVAPMLETLLRVPVHLMPGVWAPYFLERRIAALAEEGAAFGYRAGRRPWKLATLEPNASVVETCHYPMLVCDECYRARPDAVQHLFVVDSLHLKAHPTFVHFARSLDLVRRNQASFEPHIDAPAFMARHADAVVSHQWDCAQSSMHYEVLHGGYPLIHNSAQLGDAGYHYPDFDSAAGARALLEAWLHHDERLDGYHAKTRRLLQSVSIDNPANRDAFVMRLVA